MLSFLISNLDLGVIFGGGFVAVSVIMGIIAYASMQTMKSVKAENRFKELVMLGNKTEFNGAGSPPRLQSMTSRLMLQSPPLPLSSSQIQLSGFGSSFFSNPDIPPQPSTTAPKQEVIPWSSPNPVTPTLYNDFADREPATAATSSPVTTDRFSLAIPAAPDPFEELAETKPAKMPKLPRQQFRIVIQNGKKSTKPVGQVRPRRKKVQTPKSNQNEQELQEARIETTPATLPAPLPPINDAILDTPLVLPTQAEEIETPLITKRNIKSVMNRSSLV
jgi:hypothetical protein